MSRFRNFLIIVLLLSLPVICLGYENVFTRLSVENGLSNNQVKTIFKDAFGFVWFGTIEGLDRFDGSEIRPYASKFPESVENVLAIKEDHLHRLWVGTATGLFFLKSESDKFERVRIDSSNVTVQALAFLPDSSLCIGTQNGLYVLNLKTLSSEHFKIAESENLPTNNITGIFTDNHGYCWLSTQGGLGKFELAGRKSNLFQNKSFPQNAFNSFTSICNIGNKLYLGTSSTGVVEFDLSTRTFSKGPDTGNNIILTISSDGKDHLFVGTDGDGLKVIDIRSRQVESIENRENDLSSISSNSVYSFLLDESGRYWIGTYSGGVNFSKGNNNNFKLHPYSSNYPEANKSVRSFYFAPDGSQYLGTRNGMILLEGKDGTAKIFQANNNDKNGLRSNIILALYPYKGDILIGTYGGGISLFSVTSRRISPFLQSDVFLHGNTYAFETDDNGNLWIASFNGIYRYSASTGEIVNFNTQNSDLLCNEIFEITFDSKGRLWVGSMNGTSVFGIKNNKLEKINLPDEAINRFKTNYIYEDLAGNIWICTERGGLMRLNQGLNTCKIFRDTDGLPDNSICSIIESNSGEYWISTLKGFCKLSSQSQKVIRYSLSDGLPGLVFSPAATYLSNNGLLYFGNERGLIYFSPVEISATAQKSKIMLTDFYLFGKPVSPGPKSVLKQRIETIRKIELTDRLASIGFRFVALNYINATDNDYQYMLEGYDKEWRNNGSKTTVFYDKLKPGNYLFKVKNTRDNEENIANSAEIEIHIVRSFYKSPLIVGFVLIAAAIGIFLLLKYIKNLKKRSLLPLETHKEKYKGTKLPEIQSSRIKIALKQFMEEQKPYLNAELKLADVAKEVGFPVHEISQVLNQELEQSFNDYVNRYRVEEVKARFEDKNYDKYTIFAIAQQCGFNSKTSFYRIFKNETGKTPADYVKDLNQE